MEYPNYEAGYTSYRVLMLGLELDIINPKTGQPQLKSANWYAVYYYPQGEQIPWEDVFDVHEITI